MWRTLIGLLSVAFIHAKERTPEDWAKELNAAYFNNGGYVATYSSENGKGGSLLVTLGSHPISGVTAAFSDMKTDNPQKAWFWTLGDDAIFIHQAQGEMGVTAVARGMRGIIQAMARIGDEVITDKDRPIRSNSDVIMTAYLEQDSFFFGPGMGTKSSSPWENDIKKGTIKASDAETVTVQTETRGDLVLSRKHGMLLSQSSPNSKGVIRVFKLEEILLAPSKEAVGKIFAGIDDKAAAEIEVGPMAAPHLFLGLTNIIYNSDHGFADISLLEAACEKEADTLRTFARQCVKQSKDTWPTGDDWKKALATGKNELRKEWIKSLPAGVQPDEKDFENYLARADVRDGFRAAFAEGLAAKEGATAIAMNELFKKQLAAKTEVGKAAKQILETAITKAYVAVITDEKLKTFWSQREGLD